MNTFKRQHNLKKSYIISLQRMITAALKFDFKPIIYSISKFNQEHTHAVLNLICRYELLKILDKIKKDEFLLKILSKLSVDRKREFLRMYIQQKTPYLRDYLNSIYFLYQAQRYLSLDFGLCEYLTLTEKGFTCSRGRPARGFCEDLEHILCRFVYED